MALFFFFQYLMVAVEWKLVEFVTKKNKKQNKIVVARSLTADGNLLQPTGGVDSTPRTSFSCSVHALIDAHHTACQVLLHASSHPHSHPCHERYDDISHKKRTVIRMLCPWINQCRPELSAKQAESKQRGKVAQHAICAARGRLNRRDRDTHLVILM